jgi:histidinol phosphatase-like PHP family hydrolase
MSNLEQVVGQLIKACSSLAGNMDVRVIPGVELTHIPPLLVPDMVRKAREAGARLVLVHGETIVEPVPAGTNRAAIESGVDILAHPGLITPEEVRLARDSSVCLEISGRKGHSLANGHVAKLAREYGTGLTFGSDTHEPGDIRTFEEAKKICLGAGLSESEIDKLFENAWEVAERVR